MGLFTNWFKFSKTNSMGSGPILVFELECLECHTQVQVEVDSTPIEKELVGNYGNCRCPQCGEQYRVIWTRGLVGEIPVSLQRTSYRSGEMITTSLLYPIRRQDRKSTYHLVTLIKHGLKLPCRQRYQYFGFLAEMLSAFSFQTICDGETLLLQLSAREMVDSRMSLEKKSEKAEYSSVVIKDGQQTIFLPQDLERRFLSFAYFAGLARYSEQSPECFSIDNRHHFYCRAADNLYRIIEESKNFPIQFYKAYDVVLNTEQLRDELWPYFLFYSAQAVRIDQTGNSVALIWLNLRAGMSVGAKRNDSIENILSGIDVKAHPGAKDIADFLLRVINKTVK